MTPLNRMYYSLVNAKLEASTFLYPAHPAAADRPQEGFKLPSLSIASSLPGNRSTVAPIVLNAPIIDNSDRRCQWGGDRTEINQAPAAQETAEQAAERERRRRNNIAFGIGAFVVTAGSFILGYGQSIYQEQQQALRKIATLQRDFQVLAGADMLPQLNPYQHGLLDNVYNGLTAVHERTVARTHKYGVALVFALAGGVSLVVGSLASSSPFIGLGYALLTGAGSVAAYSLGTHWNDRSRNTVDYTAVHDSADYLLNQWPTDPRQPRDENLHAERVPVANPPGSNPAYAPYYEQEQVPVAEPYNFPEVPVGEIELPVRGKSASSILQQRQPIYA